MHKSPKYRIFLNLCLCYVCLGFLHARKSVISLARTCWVPSAHGALAKIRSLVQRQNAEKVRFSGIFHIRLFDQCTSKI